MAEKGVTGDRVGEVAKSVVTRECRLLSNHQSQLHLILPGLPDFKKLEIQISMQNLLGLKCWHRVFVLNVCI